MKLAEPKNDVIKTSAKATKRVTRHKRNHKTPSHDLVKTREPKFYLMVLEAFESASHWTIIQAVTNWNT